MIDLRKCEHGFHHPVPFSDYPHSCDGCWCEVARDMRDYGWRHPEGGKSD